MSKINKAYLIGSDPEVFLVDDNRKVVSSIGLVGGTKIQPISMGEEGFFCQEDNVLAEFNIPPSRNKEEFVHNIHHGLELLKRRLPEGIHVDVSPYAFFEENQLLSREAKEFGCDPDFNCWTGRENDAPIAKNMLLRTAGGHVSIGYKEPEAQTSIELAKWMDAYIATPSIHLSNEAPRRELYGKRGAMRIKEFGMEYRTVSNFWLKTVKHTEWLYDQVSLAIEAVNEGMELSFQDEMAIEASVNQNNKRAADFLIKKYQMNLL